MVEPEGDVVDARGGRVGGRVDDQVVPLGRRDRREVVGQSQRERQCRPALARVVRPVEQRPPVGRDRLDEQRRLWRRPAEGELDRVILAVEDPEQDRLAALRRDRH